MLKEWLFIAQDRTRKYGFCKGKSPGAPRNLDNSLFYRFMYDAVHGPLMRWYYGGFRFMAYQQTIGAYNEWRHRRNYK